MLVAYQKFQYYGKKLLDKILLTKDRKGKCKNKYYHITFETPCPHIHTSREIKKKISEEKRTKIDSFNISELNPRNEIQPDEEYDNISHTAFHANTEYYIVYIEFTFYVFFHDKRYFFFVCLFVFVLTHYTQSLPTYE